MKLFHVYKDENRSGDTIHIIPVDLTGDVIKYLMILINMIIMRWIITILK